MKVLFTTGNFDLAIEGELNENAKAKFQQAGFNWVVQRDVASKVYLDLGGVENEKGKKVLPKDFERKSIEFSDESQLKMQTAAAIALSPYGEFTVGVTRHEGAEAASPMKRATEFVDSLFGTAKESQLRSFLAMYDGEAESADRDGLIKIANEAGVGVQKKKA